MTSAYDRTLTVQTLGEGEGGQESARRGTSMLCLAEGEILHFKHPACFSGKLHGRPDFYREKKQQQQQNESFFPPIFYVYIGLNNRERARAKNK